MLSRRAALVFGIADVLVSVLVLLGVFVALPARWAPVDAAAGVLGALELAAGVGLLTAKPWASRLARLASTVALIAGLGVVSALALTASWLRGVYGPVGFGGAVILTLVAVLAFPYLVVLPLVQLAWLLPPAAERLASRPREVGG
jgi:hypothetical protein